jgi:hypothetical protein
MAAHGPLTAKLEALYEVLLSLRQDSRDADIQAFADFFDENCTAWLKSMREYDTPSLGRVGVIDGIRDNLQNYYLEGRQVLSSSESGSRVFCEMKNRLVVCGETLDPFYETAVVEFNTQNLISSFKLYSCRSHIVMIVQQKTGVGPYTDTSDGKVPVVV